MTSRMELVAWVNDLLQISYTKIEQCGAGGAYCQIIDSIYLDVPMQRVKMNAKHEYEYIANFKILQTFFKQKKIDKPIPIDKLVKCKMQDNLEFMQWIKRFWEQNYPGHEYDPVARRRGVPIEPPATMAPLRAAGSSSALSGSNGGAVRGKTPVGGARRPMSATPNAELAALHAQVKELSIHMEGLEKERDFYFAKLRDIEIIVQQQLDNLEVEKKDDETLRDIQKILYQTEDGFEVPEGELAEGNGQLVDEEETF